MAGGRKKYRNSSKSTTKWRRHSSSNSKTFLSTCVVRSRERRRQRWRIKVSPYGAVNLQYVCVWECLWIYRAIYGYILNVLCLVKLFVSPPACPSIVNYASTWLRLAALCCSLSRKLLVAGNLEPLNHIYMPQTRRDTTHITTLHTFCQLVPFIKCLSPQSIPPAAS